MTYIGKEDVNFNPDIGRKCFIKKGRRSLLPSRSQNGSKNGGGKFAMSVVKASCQGIKFILKF